MESVIIKPAASAETCDEGHELVWEAIHNIQKLENEDTIQCKKCKEKKDIGSLVGWICIDCKYFICTGCKPLEKKEVIEKKWEYCPKKHLLVKMTSKEVCDEYNSKKNSSTMAWRCDNCRKMYRQNDDAYDWHCSICGFDICPVCKPE